MNADLTNPVFTDEDKAREWLETHRWPNGPFCPYCGQFETVSPFKGKSMGPGWYHCNDCRRKFTVRVGTLYERSHIPLHKWLLATHLLSSSKKGMSAHQLHRMLGVTYKSAWFMAHRIREGMADKKPTGPLGGDGKIVEADELYTGKREGPIKHSRKRINWKPTKGGKSGPAQKRVVIGLVERGGETRLVHIDHATKESVRDVVVRNISRESALHTDESRLYTTLGYEFDAHRTVHHASGEYVRYEAGVMVTTNTIENVFSVFKRGMHGTYQHCGEAHLHRYLAEFAFRHNNRSALGVTDKERAEKAIAGIEGKRFIYRRAGEAANA
jgi:transposase-like protein